MTNTLFDGYYSSLVFRYTFYAYDHNNPPHIVGNRPTEHCLMQFIIVFKYFFC